MNDNESKVMTFTSVVSASDVIDSSGVATHLFYPLGLLSPDSGNQPVVTPTAGRIFFAGMMFDRLRFRSYSVTIRPTVMPSSAGTSNYVLYAAWDRYGSTGDNAVESTYSIQSDPSAKQVVWTPGGSGTPLRTWIYSTSRDRLQYYPIEHNASLVSWGIPSDLSVTAPFRPTLLVAIYSGATTSVTVRYTLQVRATIEFQGGYSNSTLNYTPPTRSVSLASADSADPSKLYSVRSDPGVESLVKSIRHQLRIINDRNPSDNDDNAQIALEALDELEGRPPRYSSRFQENPDE